MSEIRERLEEIQRLVGKWREGEVLADDRCLSTHASGHGLRRPPKEERDDLA